MSKGIDIELLQLDSEQEQQVLGAVKVIAEYMREQVSIRDSVKETLELLVNDLSANKDSAKIVKKHVKKAARHYFANDKDAVMTDNEILESLLSKLENTLVDQV